MAAILILLVWIIGAVITFCGACIFTGYYDDAPEDMDSDTYLIAGPLAFFWFLLLPVIGIGLAFSAAGKRLSRIGREARNVKAKVESLTGKESAPKSRKR